MSRTLEQRLKFDSGLPVGTSLVTFTYRGNVRKALVRIGRRGKVSYFAQPLPEDMYSAWQQVKGDLVSGYGGVILWGAKNPELMKEFEGESVASLELS